MPEPYEIWVGHVVASTIPVMSITFFKFLPNSVEFKAPGDIWNPLSKTVLSKCCFILE